MVTTRRTISGNGIFAAGSKGSALGLLERNPDASVPKNNLNPSENETEAKARMQGNLDRILNYERYNESFGKVEAQVKEDSAAATEPAAEEKEKTTESVSLSADEDIRPTSTTMQFGDIDVDTLYGDMKKGEKETYRLSSKGKLLVVLYSLAVAVIMALIIINTGVLASVSKATAKKADELASLQSEYAAVNERIEAVSDNGYVSGIAENDLSMVKVG